MNKTQYRRWRQFALKLAKHGYPHATKERRDKIACEVADFIDSYETYFREITDWDGGCGEHYVGDDMNEWLSQGGYDRSRPGKDGSYDTRFSCQVHSCVRAGLDVASSPSAGVLGFDVGTLRRMYRGRIPRWVREFFDPPLSDQADDASGVWL